MYFTFPLTFLYSPMQSPVSRFAPNVKQGANFRSFWHQVRSLKKKGEKKTKHLGKIPWLTNIHHVGEQGDVTPHLWHHSSHGELVEARLGAMLPLRISEARASVSRRLWHFALRKMCLYSVMLPLFCGNSETYFFCVHLQKRKVGNMLEWRDKWWRRVERVVNSSQHSCVLIMKNSNGLVEAVGFRCENENAHEELKSPATLALLRWSQCLLLCLIMWSIFQSWIQESGTIIFRAVSLS